jgi:glycosyltransferase involved in cell wall biosynthesis
VHVVSRRVRRSDSEEERSDRFMNHRVYRLIFAPQRNWKGAGGSDDVAQKGLLGRLYFTYLVTIYALFVSMYASLLVKRHRIDVIVERETSFGAGALTSLFTGRPLILEVVGPRYSRMSAQRSKWVLYYTESMLRDWVASEKRVAVTAGVNLSLFHPDEEERQGVRRRLGFGEGDVVAGYVGTFQKWHGIDTLISAVKIAREEVSSVRALLIGPATPSTLEQAASLGLGNYCTFVGVVEYSGVPGYIDACDVMIAPYNPSVSALRRSYGIGWPIKVLEYMACGKPVIASRVDPVDKVIAEPELGVLVAPGDSSQLARAIAELARDKDRASKIGRQGQEMVERQYSWARVAEHVSSLVERA